MTTLEENVTLATRVKGRTQDCPDAKIGKLWHSKRRFSYGFNFGQGAVGDKIKNDDGSTFEVLAVV